MNLLEDIKICIAITKLGKQCLKNKSQNHHLFCGTHIENKPSYVFMHIKQYNFASRIKYTNEDDYISQLKTMEEQCYNEFINQNMLLSITNNNNDANAGNGHIPNQYHNNISNHSITYQDYMDDNEINDINDINNFNHNMIKALQNDYVNGQYIDDDEPGNVNMPGNGKKESKECKICYSEYELHELTKCNSPGCINHISCYQCLLGHVKSLINDGIGSMDCMFNSSDKCGGVYVENDIRKAIAEDDDNANNKQEFLNKWNEIVIMTEITRIASICKDYQICPLCCKWGCIFESHPGFINTYNTSYFITCGGCGKLWCSNCKRKEHMGRSCYCLEFDNNENHNKKKEVVRNMLLDMVSRVLTHGCSICGCIYIKEEGCNLMTCPKCMGLSCYICGIKLHIRNNNKYWHFSGHEGADVDATCPLWNNKAGDGKANQGNTEYNMRKIENEIELFLNENKNNNSIYNLIKTEIKELWKNDKDYKEIIRKLSLDNDNNNNNNNHIKNNIKRKIF